MCIPEEGTAVAPGNWSVQVYVLDSVPGQTVSKVKRRLRGVFVEAEWHQPSVVLLDDMDHATPHFLDAQEEAMGEGALSTRRAQGGPKFKK